MEPRTFAAAARSVVFRVVLGSGLLALPIAAPAQTLLDPGLSVTPVISGLSQPISIAFIGPGDLLVTEKASGQVKRVVNGLVTGSCCAGGVGGTLGAEQVGRKLPPAVPLPPSAFATASA